MKQSLQQHNTKQLSARGEGYGVPTAGHNSGLDREINVYRLWGVPLARTCVLKQFLGSETAAPVVTDLCWKSVGVIRVVGGRGESQPPHARACLAQPDIFGWLAPKDQEEVNLRRESRELVTRRVGCSRRDVAVQQPASHQQSGDKQTREVSCCSAHGTLMQLAQRCFARPVEDNS